MRILYVVETLELQCLAKGGVYRCCFLSGGVKEQTFGDLFIFRKVSTHRRIATRVVEFYTKKMVFVSGSGEKQEK